MANQVEGVEQLVAKLQQIEGGTEKGLPKIVMAAALTLEGIVKRSMNTGAHSGRLYRRGQRSHQASAPGETPAIDYGNLINSVQSQLAGAGESAAGTAEALVFTNADYADDLEFGTSKMAARPFMRPALDEHEQEIQDAAIATLRAIVEAEAHV